MLLGYIGAKYSAGRALKFSPSLAARAMSAGAGDATGSTTLPVIRLFKGVAHINVVVKPGSFDDDIRVIDGVVEVRTTAPAREGSVPY
jgi:hypothetical protein